MGNRLSKIYTRTGDDGTTGLADGQRVKKNSTRVIAMGDVDELNSALGLILAFGTPLRVKKSLERIQHELFNLGGELAMPDYCLITPEHVETLEQELDAFNQLLPPLKEFILPGGSRVVAQCHMARAICRRAERQVWQLHEEEVLNAALLQYLNRLSDFLFVLCRILARNAGQEEVYWRSDATLTDI